MLLSKEKCKWWFGSPATANCQGLYYSINLTALNYNIYLLYTLNCVCRFGQF